MLGPTLGGRSPLCTCPCDHHPRTQHDAWAPLPTCAPQVTRGVLYTREEAEGTRLKHPNDTITEGIGLNRLTANFAAAAVDGAFRGSDREAVEMAAHLLRCERGGRGQGAQAHRANPCC